MHPPPPGRTLRQSRGAAVESTEGAAVPSSHTTCCVCVVSLQTVVCSCLRSTGRAPPSARGLGGILRFAPYTSIQWVSDRWGRLTSLRFPPSLVKPGVRFSRYRLSSPVHASAVTDSCFAFAYSFLCSVLGIYRVDRSLRTNLLPLGCIDKHPVTSGPFPPVAVTTFLGTMGPSDVLPYRQDLPRFVDDLPSLSFPLPRWSVRLPMSDASPNLQTFPKSEEGRPPQSLSRPARD